MGFEKDGRLVLDFTSDVYLVASLFSESGAFFSATVSQTTQTIVPPLFSESGAFFAATVVPGGVDIAPPLFSESGAFFSAVVANIYTPVSEPAPSSAMLAEYSSATEFTHDWANLTGWTGGSNGIELRNKVAGEAQDRNNFVELDTTKNSTMYQTITGTGWVTLSFWYSARPNTGATNGLGYSLGTFSGSVLHGVSNSTSVNDWQQFTRVVNLGTSPTSLELKFYAEGPSDSYGGSIDNISVTSAVPEPESYVMLLAGMGLIGAVARRRQGKARVA